MENEYQRLINGPGVFSSYTDEGIYLRRDRDEGMAWRLRPELPDRMPNESLLVVRTAALRELERRISGLDKEEEKPLLKRERDNLLVIIAALAKLARIDLAKPFAAAKAVESQILLEGCQEPKERAIENHLKRAAEVMGDRSRD